MDDALAQDDATTLSTRREGLFVMNVGDIDAGKIVLRPTVVMGRHLKATEPPAAVGLIPRLAATGMGRKIGAGRWLGPSPAPDERRLSRR